MMPATARNKDMNPSNCNICKTSDNDQPDHNNSEQHRFNFLLWEWAEYRKALVKNRRGVEIDIKPVDKNLPYNEEYRIGLHSVKVSPKQLVRQKNYIKFTCTVKNIKRESSVFLTHATLLHPYDYFSLYDPNLHIQNGKILELVAGSEYTVEVQFCTNKNVIVGTYKIPVAFGFQADKEDFTIARSIVVTIDDGAIKSEAQHEKSPFTNTDWPSTLTVIQPDQKLKYVNHYLIPKDYYKCIKLGLNEFDNMNGEDFLALHKLRDFMEPGHVTAKNYRDFWHIVLWLEETGLSLMLSRYNMENVNVKILANDLLELEVPGLAEKRPSVMIGDFIDIKIHGDHTVYRGVIKTVTDKTVEIAYLKSGLLQYIKKVPHVELDVRFTLGRLPLERMHQGVDQTALLGRIGHLFPTVERLKNVNPETIDLADSEFYNKAILDNREQKTAVLKILNGTSGESPYIVFGPPGTGKTDTIVEAILQLKSKTALNILICAPANAACNMVTEKLMKYCTKHELIRIMAENMDCKTVSQDVLNYSNFDMNGMFKKISPREVQQYRIVVTTLILVGRYVGKYKPDIVFIDEAAQAGEPEVSCALGMLKSHRIILAGDHKQLGPITNSKTAEKYGLGVSLLERLMNLELYKSENENFITMLKLNFRSHPIILKIPNKLFYDDQLQAVSTTSFHDQLAKIFIYDKIQQNYHGGIEKPGQAIEFCNVMSKESREGRSPSYFNETEINMVLKYVQQLTALNVSPTDIGIVTPYIRQVYKIKYLLEQYGHNNVEVGTTETFQGREKRVIIISTVRAQMDLLLVDRRYNLGFVRNDKRFNVAITRAKSKLIVIGSALVLGTDSKWRDFMELCRTLNTFCGAPYIERTLKIRDDIINRMEQVTFRDQYKT